MILRDDGNPCGKGFSPADYGAIFWSRSMIPTLDQPRVAVAVAQLLVVAANGRRFFHLPPCGRRAAGRVSDWNRGAVCEKLLPYCCSDLAPPIMKLLFGWN